MSLLDIRTILIGFVVSDAICALVIGSLWFQHRRRSPELWLWTTDFVLQTVSILLIALRGFVPDTLSMVGGNALGIAGTILLFIGLERYLGRQGPQAHNWVMLAVFTAIHTYFATASPILAVRNLNLSAALLFICVQCAWLLLHRAEPRLRQATKYAGIVFSSYALISVVRIVESLVATTGNDYLRSGLFDALVLLSYQMLFIALTFSLVLMVNRRLSAALEEDIAQRERAEEALRKRNEFIETILENAPIGFAVNTIDDGKRVFVGHSFEDIYGVLPDSISSVSDYFDKVFLDPTYRQQIRDRIMADMATGEASRMRWENIPITTLAGEHKVVTIMNIPLLEQNFMISTVQDITEQWRAEQALAVSHSALLEAQAIAHIGDWSIDMATRTFAWSDEMYVIHGMKPGAPILHSTYLGLIHPEDRKRVFEVMGLAMAGKQQEFVVDYRIVRPDGTDRFVTLTGKTVLDSNGEVTGIRGTTQDITDRKKVEEQLRNTSNYLNSLLDNANAPIIVWDSTHNITLFNRAFERLTGRSVSSVLGQQVDLLFPPAEREKSLGDVRRASSGERWETVEIGIQGVDGSVRTLLWNSASLYASDGATVVATIAQGQDITDRKRAESEKEAMQLRLLESKKLEAVGQLAGGVAHNFNNLLTGILGYIDIARSDLDPLHPATSSLDTARTAALQAASLARQLLSFGRSAMLLPTVQSANNAVESALDLVCSSLPGSIEVVRDLNPDAWDILVDSSQLTQVLLELANNACEAMEDKGTITVHTRNVTVDDTYVATAPSARMGEFVVVSVADTGPGIDPAMVQRLFEPFATTKLFGRGMGLATVFGALKQARGWADTHSEQGAGTRIDLYLPRHVEGESPAV